MKFEKDFRRQGHIGEKEIEMWDLSQAAFANCNGSLS